MLSYKCVTSLSCPVGFFVCCPHQLAVVMWLFTYVGAVFNGITILILGKYRGKQESGYIHIHLPIEFKVAIKRKMQRSIISYRETVNSCKFRHMLQLAGVSCAVL